MHQAGYVFDGRYTVVERVGVGGYGTVLRVEDSEDGHHYALKYCIGDDEDLDRFKREMNILEGVYLENVIKVVHVEINHSPPYYVMPIAEGDLSELAGEFQSNIEEVLVLFRKICNGVSGLHSKHCFHRDLKPQNIVIIEKEPFICDFGLAKMEIKCSLSLTQTALGTIEYSPPEQFDAEGSKHADARSDVFALGKLLYWLVTNKSPSTLFMEQLPDYLRPVIGKATQHRKEDRYQSVSELIAIIDYILKSNIGQGVDFALPRTPHTAVSELASAMQAIESSNEPLAVSKVREFMRGFYARLVAFSPKYGGDDLDDELLIQALEHSIPEVTDFAELCGSIARHNSSSAAIASLRGLERWIDEYSFRAKQPSSYHNYFFDYPKFLGHELYITLVGILVSEERWSIIETLVTQGLVLKNAPGDKKDYVGFEYISQNLSLLDRRNRRLKLNRLSLHSDILMDRHSKGDLGRLAPITALTDADYFLYLRSVFSMEQMNLYEAWIPWSTVHSAGAPDFLFRSISKSYATRLLGPLGLQSVEAFREFLAERGKAVSKYFAEGFWVHPVSRFDATRIGSK